MLPIYQYLDYLPHPPKNLLGDLSRFYKNKSYIYRPADVVDPWKVEHGVNLSGDPNPREFYNFAIDGELEDWLRVNIMSAADTYAVGLYGAFDDVNNNRPMHIDSSRNYVLMYLTDLGGAQVETSWYQCTGLPLVLNVDQKDMFHQKELTEVDRVCFELNRWVAFNVKIIHQVTGLTGLRQSIQLGCCHNPFRLI